MARKGHAILLGLLACAGCGSTTYKVGIVVDPPTASVYVNGERVGPGGRRVYEIDFGKHDRVCIQAVAPSHIAVTEMLSRQQIKDQVDKYGDFTWVLKQEK
jgi:hypothetical protein